MIKIELKRMSIQELNGSFFIYLPKFWVLSTGMKKGDIIVWSVEEGDYKTLQLKKSQEE